ncbi:hypothetical protein ACFL6U_04050 [Planctomycetota bacterium]
MKNLRKTIVLILVCCGGHTALGTWSFDYFGEERPGMEMKRFNPQIPGLEGELVSLIFTPDGNECYITMKTGEIGQVYLRRSKNGIWSTYQPVNFPDRAISIDGFSPDGQYLFFYHTGKLHWIASEAVLQDPNDPLLNTGTNS